MITEDKYTITEREHTGEEDVLLDLEYLREHTMGDVISKTGEGGVNTQGKRLYSDLGGLR